MAASHHLEDEWRKISFMELLSPFFIETRNVVGPKSTARRASVVTYGRYVLLPSFLWIPFSIQPSTIQLKTLYRPNFQLTSNTT